MAQSTISVNRNEVWKGIKMPQYTYRNGSIHSSCVNFSPLELAGPEIYLQLRIYLQWILKNYKTAIRKWAQVDNILTFLGNKLLSFILFIHLLVNGDALRYFNKSGATSQGCESCSYSSLIYWMPRPFHHLYLYGLPALNNAMVSNI